MRLLQVLSQWMSNRGLGIPVHSRHCDPLSREHQTLFNLTKMERGFLMKSLHHYGTTQVFCLLQLAGPQLEVDLLGSALRRLQMQHPFLRCRPRFINNRFLFEHSWEVSIPIYRSSSSWSETWSRIQKEVALFWESTAQVWLIWDEQAQRNDLIVSLSHAICDGASAHTLIQELVQILNSYGTSIDSGVEESIDLSQVCLYLPRASSSLVFSSISVARLFDSIGFILESLWHASSLNSLRIKGFEGRLSPEELAEKNRTIPRVIEVNADVLSRLQFQSKMYSTSLTAIVTSAYAEALRVSCVSSRQKSWLESLRAKILKSYVKIIWPVQLRSLYSGEKVKDDLSMHTSFLTLSVPIDGGEVSVSELWSRAVKLGQNARKKIKRRVPLVFSYIAARATATPLSRSPRGHSALFSISSLGRLNIAESSGRWSLLNFNIFCQLASCKHPSLIVFTQDQRLIITLLASYPTIDQSWIERLEIMLQSTLERMAQADHSDGIDLNFNRFSSVNR